MELSDRSGLKGYARQALEQADFNHRLLVLLHTGGILAVNLLVSLVLYMIGNQVEDTGGLAGMQTRAIWSTLESVLLYAIPVLTVLWNAGYVYVSMGLARGQRMEPRDLLGGFRHPISVLGCVAWPGLQYIARAIICSVAASMIFMLTPFAQPVVEIIQNLPTELVDGEVMLVVNEATQNAMIPHMTPVMVIFAILFIPMALRLFYRFRLAMYLLLDGQERGCLAALRASRWRMRGNQMMMLRLDLSFWWFYLLQGIALAVCYLDTWLPMLGVQLPLSGFTLGVATYLVYAVVQLAVDLLTKNDVQTTYAAAYDVILAAQEPKTEETEER